MATVTVNDKILNALNLYHKSLTTKISDEYVAQEVGKGLSTNDFTNEEKNKLDGISTETFVVKVDGKGLSTNDFTNSDKEKLDGISTDTFVVKVDGKGLSTNDFTNSDKEKLSDIETDAQKNIIEKIKVNGTFAEIDSDTKVASITVEGGSGGGLSFVVGDVQPTGNNILWLDTSE